LEESRQRAKSNRTFVRSSSKRYVRQTMPTMHVMRSPNGREANGYGASNIFASNIRPSHPQPISCSSPTTENIAKQNSHDLNSSNIRSTASFWFSSTTNKLIRGISSSMVKLNTGRRANYRRDTSAPTSQVDSNSSRTGSVSNTAPSAHKIISLTTNDSTMPKLQTLSTTVPNKHYATFSSRSARARSVSSGNVQPLSRRLPLRQSLGNLNSGYSLHPTGVPNNGSRAAAFEQAWTIGQSTSTTANNAVTRTMDAERHLTNGSAYVGSIRRSSVHRISSNCNGIITNKSGNSTRSQVTERCSLFPKPAWLQDDIT
jgi:hypothetical protein